jgi:hypothetical protein
VTFISLRHKLSFALFSHLSRFKRLAQQGIDSLMRVQLFAHIFELLSEQLVFVLKLFHLPLKSVVVALANAHPTSAAAAGALCGQVPIRFSKFRNEVASSSKNASLTEDGRFGGTTFLK